MEQIFTDHPGTLVFGHRGLPRQEKENTIISFQAAILVGVDGIELDVHLTKDNQLVVIHDFNTIRTTGIDCEIESHTLAEIQQVDFQIPTLSQVFDAFNNQILYDIEIKEKLKPNPLLSSLLAEEIRKRKLQDNVMVSSFNPLSLRVFHRYYKQIPLAPIYDIDESVPKLFQKGFGRIAVKYSALKPGNHVYENSYSRFKDKTLFSVWCIDTKEEYLHLLKRQTRIVISNKADVLLKN